MNTLSQKGPVGCQFTLVSVCPGEKGGESYFRVKSQVCQVQIWSMGTFSQDNSLSQRDRLGCFGEKGRGKGKKKRVSEDLGLDLI